MKLLDQVRQKLLVGHYAYRTEQSYDRWITQYIRWHGLRLDWPNRWLLVRGSNTEPIVRIIAEAPTREEAQQICAKAAKAIGPK